jgi:hypothetical protein
VQYFLIILHCATLGYSAGYMEYIFGDGFGQYLHMLDINCTSATPHYKHSVAC